MKRDDVLAALERERTRLFAAVGALGPRVESLAVTGEGWTAKDVLAHCIHWTGQIAFGMGAKLEPPSYIRGVAGRPSWEEWNAMAVAHYGAMPLDEVRRELDTVVERLLARIRLSDDATMLRPDVVKWGDRPLWEQIGSETFLHWPGHAEDLERLA